ncbi:MAG TPA: hypothetical protein VGE07_30070 [Herpetosiphonaceae bacterium]
MSIATMEQVHRYPRRYRIPFELLSTALALLAMIRFGRDALRYAWEGVNLNPNVDVGPGLLRTIIRQIDRPGPRPDSLGDLVGPLLWLALTLLFVLFLRNFFPTIRTSSRGILIEWSNSWLPIGWEQIRGLRVTEDLAGERFVLLMQTDNKALTGWHRFYSALYRLTFMRGFLITSAVSNFEPLVSTLLQELDSVARQVNKPPVRLDERSASPLFQLLLSPAGFFSRRSKTDQEYVSRAEMAARTAQPGHSTTIMSTYPQRIRSLVFGFTAVLALFGLLRALDVFRQFLGRAIPALRSSSFFASSLPESAATWWLPVSALLILGLMFPLLMVIRNILPDVESRPQGLAVRYFNRWLLVPWNEITAVKSADLSEKNHVVLIQTTNRVLKGIHRASSFLFEGNQSRGVLLTSALSTFEPLLQQIVLEVARGQRQAETEDGLLVEDAPAWLLRLLFKPSDAIDRLLAAASRDENTTRFDFNRVIQSGHPMLWVAGVPTVMLLVELLVNQGLPPSPSRIATAFAFFVFCLIEWPLASMLAQVLENNQDDDAHKARPFYLYPLIQLPRFLVLVLALLLLLLGVPILPALLWFGAAIWSFLLTAGLWEGLYGWHGTQLLAMGAVPAIYQLVTLIAYGALT